MFQVSVNANPEVGPVPASGFVYSLSEIPFEKSEVDMSAVIIREDVEPRIEALANLMRWDLRKAAGCFRYLWRGSQNVNAKGGTGAEILFWAKESDPDEGARLLEVLQHRTVRMLTKAGPDRFKIHGNAEEVFRKKGRESRARNAAKKRWELEHGISLNDEDDEEMSDAQSMSSSMSENMLENIPQAKPSQAKHIQAKPSHNLGSGGSSTPPGPLVLTSPPDEPARPRKARANHGPTTDGGRVWEAYRESYFARYGQEPVRNAKANTNCAQLVGRLGADAAIKVVRFYLTHQNRWYVQNVHPLGLCLKDAEGLHTQMLAGHRVTTAEAQTKDRQAGNLQAFTNVYQKLKAEGVIKDEP